MVVLEDGKNLIEWLFTSAKNDTDHFAKGTRALTNG